MCLLLHIVADAFEEVYGFVSLGVCLCRSDEWILLQNDYGLYGTRGYFLIVFL